MTHRRIIETIGIRYDDLAHVASIVDAIKNMLLNHSGIDNQQTIIVNFNGFGASSLNLYVYAFTKTTNWVVFHEVKQSLLLEIAAIIEQHGAQIALPTQTLHIETLAEHP
jgi:MscS family membrane protein